MEVYNNVGDYLGRAEYYELVCSTWDFTVHRRGEYVCAILTEEVEPKDFCL